MHSNAKHLPWTRKDWTALMSKSVLAWQAASVARAPVLPQGGSIVGRAPQPVAHVTRQKRLAELLAIGDTIWVVGRYAKLSHASVSLIGRIIIAKTNYHRK